ncbi:tetratricopeptide repeat protein [Noviherbaspirillum sp.]|jgi:tetratricopeptide (TPR) repeat protein|uniref:tetratricopeptide repeat protein n=1 Tax=Noviherbaspirillum sp. TaxID=1926288 RepID=UPI0025D3D5A8|nr:tetratricopeptide repeat protein [Noviherbaspirillum sp.]
MLFEHVKKRIINGLIEEINGLDPVGLELVGHSVIEILETKKMIHHGINKDYKPSGYTVDSFSNDSTVIGEYGTGKDYFNDVGSKAEPKFDKIENDIKHAIQHKQPNGPEKIYLISSQEEPPSFRAKFNQTPFGQSHGKIVTIYDARELAKIIYEQSTANSNNASFYRNFFLGFSQDLDNYEYYGKVPALCEHHCSDDGILSVIRHHYAKGKSICVLYGLSGSGKTQAAIDFIHHDGNAFENYVWIAGEDWKPDTSLSAIQRSRGGIPINVAGLFNSAKTVLVIDSIERSLDDRAFQELGPGFVKGGVVLATSQVAVPGSPLYLSIPTLSREVAFEILGEDLAASNETCEQFVEACSFSPLILATTRKIVELQEVSKSDLYNEILAVPEDIDQGDGTSIMRRILGRLEQRNREALARIADSGSSAHDFNFLAHFIGINQRLNLQRLSILKPTRTPGVMSVHDLVCKAVQSKIDGRVLAEEIESYIDKHSGEMTPSVLRQIHLSARQISGEHVRRGNREPDWLTYALLQIDGEVRMGIHEQIYAKQITATPSLASVMCIIDAKEAHAYTIEDQEQRRGYYQQCADEYLKAIQASASGIVKAELLHHRGKALRRCGQFDDALECFTELLRLEPEWHATYGQIAHLGIQRGVDLRVKQEGEQAMRTLLDGMLANASSVPLRVSLGAFARLRSYRSVIDVISSDPSAVKRLADIIAMSALEGLDQFYEAFVSFTSIFGYHHSLICVELAEALPEMLAMPPESVDAKQWTSACEALTNTVVAAGRAGKPELSKRIAQAGSKFADALNANENVAPYVARAIAKAYAAADMPHKALERIAKVPAEAVDHWLLYQKSKAQLAIGANGEALNSAREAFNLAQKDAKVQQRLSIYHDQLSRCHESLDDHPAAIAEAETALKKCTDDEYKNALAQRLVSLESRKN